MVPRISYASVEKIFIEFANSSPIGNLGRKVSQTLEGFKVAQDTPRRTCQTVPNVLSRQSKPPLLFSLLGQYSQAKL